MKFIDLKPNCFFKLDNDIYVKLVDDIISNVSSRNSRKLNSTEILAEVEPLYNIPILVLDLNIDNGKYEHSIYRVNENGQLHGLQEMRINTTNNVHYYFNNELLHRLDGPAVYYPTPTTKTINRWFINGKEYTDNLLFSVDATMYDNQPVVLTKLTALVKHYIRDDDIGSINIDGSKVTFTFYNDALRVSKGILRRALINNKWNVTEITNNRLIVSQ